MTSEQREQKTVSLVAGNPVQRLPRAIFEIGVFPGSKRYCTPHPKDSQRIEDWDEIGMIRSCLRLSENVSGMETTDYL